jgi:excisionase family DNA binding protein
VDGSRVDLTAGAFLDSTQAADLLGVHTSTLRNWTRRGLVPRLRVGARRTQVHPPDAGGWLGTRVDSDCY